MGRKSLIVLISFTGLGLFALAVFAQQLGIDRGSDWGIGRRIIAVTGLLLILLTIFLVTWPFWQRLVDTARRGMDQIWTTLCEIPLVQRFTLALQAVYNTFKRVWNRSWVHKILARIASSPFVHYCTETEDRKAASVTVLIGTLVFLLYVWFVSVGYWTLWPKTTSYYQQLSDAFRAGQVSLLIEPDPALSTLADPYTMANREGISYPWDVVFFQGKFYLYWGPAPALTVTLMRILVSEEIGDQVLVFFFASGVFIVSCLFMLRLRAGLFRLVRWPYMIPGILLAGLANPFPWLLNRPAVYEAAIAAGQFFLITGLFFGFLAIGKNPVRFWMLILSGSCLGLAVASRASLSYAVVFLAVMIAGYILLKRMPRQISFLQLGLFLLPLLITLAVLAWYNQIRFGDWVEFGFKYQLTGMNTHINTFSLANLPINLHNYFINPYRLLSTFPYVKPRLGGHFVFFPISSPSNYYAEHTTGIILAVPFVVFGLIPIAHLIWYAFESLAARARGVNFKDSHIRGVLFRWTAFALAGGAFFAFVPILIYIAGMMRFLGDVMPLLILLSVFGLLMGRQHLDEKPATLFWFDALVLVLTLYSVTVSLLLAVTGAEARFENLNPILFDKMTRWFTP